MSKRDEIAELLKMATMEIDYNTTAALMSAAGRLADAGGLLREYVNEQVSPPERSGVIVGLNYPTMRGYELPA